MSKSSNSEKALMKSVNNAIRQGNAAEVVEKIQKWADGDSEPIPDWDLVVGAAFWNRCVDKEMTTNHDELLVLERVYECLVKAFIGKSKDKENYVGRIKVFAATLKFFVAQNRLNLKIVEELLQEISKSSFDVRRNNHGSIKTVCLNFYALIWNYMREHHMQLTLLQSLEHASLSIRWLPILGLEEFQNISNKLGQISFLLVKNQNHVNTGIIAEFFVGLSQGIVDLLKQIVLDDSKNGVKVKRSKAVLPLPQFHGILNVTFVLTRQLVMSGDFDKALKVFRPVTSIAKLYFDEELTQVWKNMLEAYVKICMVIMNGVNTKCTDDILKSCESFRECRKQILDLNFQKTYPGYAFSFMHAFTESIGYVVSQTKLQTSSSLLKQLPLSKCVKFLKEILLAADASVALDSMKSGKYALEGVTENRKVDVQSAALFHLLKVASERISDKDSKVCKDADFKQLGEDVYRTLMTIANREDLEKTKSADLLNVLTFHTCNIGYAYQKRKNYDEAMFWCKRSIDAFEAFKARNVDVDLRVNALSIGLLKADCLRQQGKYSEGLRWLSEWLVMAPQYADCQATAYDIYEQIPWTDWSVHWQTLQKEVCMEECKTVVNYLEEIDPGSVSDKFSSRVLRLEMNAYFSGRQTLVPAIINVGQQLENLNFCMADKVLGLISQAIGLWWHSTTETLQLAITCVNESIDLLNQNTLSKDKKAKSGAGGEEPLKIYLSGLAIAWKGLCTLKIHQDIVEGQMESLKQKTIHENPDKKEKYEGLYAVTGFTSLTIEDEERCVVNFIQAAECFYQLSQIEEVFKSIADVHCPALAQITFRLVALGLSAFGDKLNAAKAWYSTYTISKLYDRKGLIVMAASEILKILPHTSLECVQHADKVNQAAQEGKLIKHNRAVYYRLDLAKAVAHYQHKNYKEGIKYLAEVYKFLSERDNFDSTHHLMAEADYVLSLYRSVSLNQALEFPSEIPEMLCKMTPAGLTLKGYKLLGGLSRETDAIASGWTDLLHNYYLLGSVAELSTRTVKLLKETGKLRDLKSFITDAVYFFQRLGIVSKSISLLVPLIETDISARNFYMAQIRIAGIANVLTTGNSRPQREAPDFAEAKKFLESNLKIPGLSISRLENISNLKWFLGDIDATSFHYRNRSSKYLTSLKVDCESINIKKMELKAPAFLRHPLTCFCYTCSHLEIIPTALEFLVAQAKYAVAMKWRISMAVLELGRLHHQRALFRVLFNLEYLTEQLHSIVTRKPAGKLIHIMYGTSFFTPGLQMQLANMEICPVKDIVHIVQLMNSALRLTEIVDNQDYSLKALPLELGTCALYEHFVSFGRIKISESDIREMLQSRVEQQEKENTILVAASPDLLEQTILSAPVAVPPAIRRRGAQQLPPSKQQQHGRKANVTSLRPRRILNSKAQLHQQELSATVELVDLTKVDNMEEDRHVPVIPGPNFDDSNGD